MTGQYDCVLVIALPAAVEEEMLDHLSSHPEWVRGFSIAHAEGVGSGARLQSTLEQVRGRAKRRIIQVLLRQQEVEPLLAGLRAAFSSGEIAWWTMPILGFGRLG